MVFLGGGRQVTLTEVAEAFAAEVMLGRPEGWILPLSAAAGRFHQGGGGRPGAGVGSGK